MNSPNNLVDSVATEGFKKRLPSKGKHILICFGYFSLPLISFIITNKNEADKGKCLINHLEKTFTVY